MKEATHGDNRHLADSLLSAAADCLHGKSHLDITSREIASHAGTHPAMVNYYFNNKDGLFSTLLNGITVDVIKHLQQIEAAVEANVEDPTAVIVHGLVEAYFPHSDGMALALVEVQRQRSVIKDAYSRRGGSQAFSRIERVVRKLMENGKYRHDLDSASTTWMIFSLVMGPLLLKPISQAMRSSVEAPNLEHWITDVTELLRKHVTSA